MALKIDILERACRGCGLCVDICPTKVFTMNETKRVCAIACVEDCIACLSCAYICPSGAISHQGHHAVKNFYRDAVFSQHMGRFL